MKQRDIIQAYHAIQSYKKKENETHKASLRCNHAIFKVQKLIEPQVEFQNEREQAILQEFHPKSDGNTLDFGSNENRDAFFDKLNELAEMEIDLGEFEKPTISLDENISLDVDEISALEPFINFT